MIDKCTCRDCSLTELSPIDCSIPKTYHSNEPTSGSVPHMSDTKKYSAENNYDEFFDHSLYYSINFRNNSFKHHEKNADNLLIMCFNICSLQRSLDQMHELLSKLSGLLDIIVLTKTKLSGSSVHLNIKLNGYDFLHVDSETHTGGVGLSKTT